MTVAETLIAGTLDLIAREGVGDLSARRLAAASGRSTMCIYSKFGARQDLLRAAYDHAATELLEEVRSRGLDGLAGFAGSDPNRYEFLTTSASAPLGVTAATRRALIEGLFAAIATHEGLDREQARDALATTHGSILLNAAATEPVG